LPRVIESSAKCDIRFRKASRDLLFLPKLFELRCNAKRVLALAGFISVFAPLLHAQTAKIYVSSKAGARLSAQPEVALTDAKPSTGTTGATVSNR